MSMQLGIGLLAGLVIGWVLFRDARLPPKRDNWPHFPQDSATRARNITTGRIH